MTWHIDITQVAIVVGAVVAFYAYLILLVLALCKSAALKPTDCPWDEEDDGPPWTAEDSARVQRNVERNRAIRDAEKLIDETEVE